MTGLLLAARNLRKTPGFTLVAIFTLALGVGANTAIFSVVKAVLLNQLPYRDPDRLVAIAEADPQTSHPITVDFTTTHDWRERSKSFESMSLYHFNNVALAEGAEPELLNGLRVNYDFFSTLGVQMAQGRTFLPEEDHQKTRFEAILTHGFWLRRFGADPTVLGRSIRLNEASFTIVGILPANFSMPLPDSDSPNVELFMPLGYDLGGDSACRGCQHLRLIGRMKPGIPAAQANAELNTVMDQIKREFPKDYSPNSGVRVTPLRDKLVGGAAAALWTLVAAVGFVLLIACANVANLLLARSSARAKEIALRVALGASRARIIGQLLTESMLLAVTGGAAGIALAFFTAAALVKFGPSQIPRLNEIHIDLTILLFSIAATLVTGLLFGLAPAFRASRADLAEAMKGLGKSTENRSRLGLRNVLIIAEFALAFVLVVGAGLLAKSFARLMNVNPGYDPHNVLTLGAYVYGSRYQGHPEAEIALYDQVMRTVRATPGVESAAMVSTLPLDGFDRRSLHIQDRPLANPADAPRADTYSITPEYFRVMRIPIKRGRAFTDQDRAGAPLAAIVSETCARLLWPHEDAIGKRILLGGPDDKRPFATIIGIAGDIHQYGLDRAPNMEAYIPLAQRTDFGYNMVIRATGDPARLERVARAAFAAADKTQPIYNVVPLESYLKSTLAERSFTLALLAMFGALALLLASVGIYGVISYTVGLRTREFGIRVALGAKKQDLAGMILRQSLTLSGAGLILGFAASLAVTRLLASLLFQVHPTDLAISTGVMVLLTAVALAASYLPARRAMAVDPTVALRDE